jgi:hypothetical protein
MAQATPKIVGNTLSVQSEGATTFLAVDTDAWFVWLESATAFTYGEDGATFTAQKRRRKEHWYWYAYAKRDRRLQCMYLGRSRDLTAGRLHAAMNRLYPLPAEGVAGHTAALWGRRSAKAIVVHQQLAALYTQASTGEHQLDLTKVKEQLQQLGHDLRSKPGRPLSGSQQALAIAHELLAALEQSHDQYTRDLTIMRRLLYEAREREAHYEGPPQQRGEVF